MARFQHIVPTVWVSSLVVWWGWLAAGQAISLEPAQHLMTKSEETGGAIAQLPSEPTGYTVLHVNATAGNDAAGDGSQLRPYRTISHALALAEANTLILLARGTYSADSGETFPLQMKSGVTIQGMAGPNIADVAIVGGGSYYSDTAGMQTIAILGADNAGLANVTVSNPRAEGIGLWVESGSPIVLENAFVQNGATGIYLVGAGTPVIRGNYFANNGKTGLVITGPSTAQVEGNVFENTGTGITVAPASAPEIINNRIFGNLDGLIVHAEARPRLRGNQIARNRRNSIVDYATWATVPDERLPGATQPTPPTAAIATAPVRPDATVSATNTTENATTATIPTPPVGEATGGPAEAPMASPAVPLPPASAAVSAESDIAPLTPTVDPISTEEEAVIGDEAVDAGVIAAVPDPSDHIVADFSDAALGDRLSQEIGEATEALNAVDISVTPAIAATVALSNVDLLPIQEAAQAASVGFGAEAIPMTSEATASSDPLDTEVFAPLPSPGREIATSSSAAASSAVLTEPEVIDIPVIPPPSQMPVKPDETQPVGRGLTQELAYALETGEHLPAVPTVPNANATATAPDPNSQRLAVPARDIPLGSGGGSLPEVFTAGAAAGLPSDGPPPPPLLATSLGLNYKVLVAAADDAAQAEVRSQVPDAFRLRFNGQMYMQAGAYPTMEEAQAMLNQLQRAGFPAQIQEIR